MGNHLLIALGIWAAGCLPLLAQEPVPKPPAKPVMMVDVKPKHYIPGGPISVLDLQTRRLTPATAPKTAVQNPPQPQAGREMQFLAIHLHSTSRAPFKEMRLEFALYKRDRVGNLHVITKGVESLTLAPFQSLLALAHGEIAADDRPLYVPWRNHTDVSDRAEEFYGWYVRITYEDKVLYEKSDPTGLKSSDLVRRDFPEKK
jgi:hypothetical protein